MVEISEPSPDNRSLLGPRRVCGKLLDTAERHSGFYLPEMLVRPVMKILRQRGIIPEKVMINNTTFTVPAYMFKRKSKAKIRALAETVIRIVEGGLDEVHRAALARLTRPAETTREIPMTTRTHAELMRRMETEDVAIVGSRLLDVYTEFDKQHPLPLLVLRQGRASVTSHCWHISDENKYRMRGLFHAARAKCLELSMMTGGMEIALHYGEAGGSQAPYPYEEDVIHVHLYMAPRPSSMKLRAVSEVYGAVLRDDGTPVEILDASHGQGAIISDGGIDVAQVIGSNFYFLAPLLSTFAVTRNLTKGIPFNVALQECWNAWRAERYGEEKEKQLPFGPRTSLELLQARIKQESDETTSLLRGAEHEVTHLEKQLEEAYGKLAKMRRMMEMHRLPITNRIIATNFPEQLEKIRDHEGFTSVDFIDGAMVCRTVPIVIDHDGHQHPLGAFGISLTSEEGFEVWAIDPVHPKGVPHPHISAEGSWCLGNSTQSIREHLAYHRYDEAIIAIYWWLCRGYTPQSALNKIAEWPTVEGVMLGEDVIEESPFIRVVPLEEVG